MCAIYVLMWVYAGMQAHINNAYRHHRRASQVLWGDTCVSVTGLVIAEQWLSLTFGNDIIIRVEHTEAAHGV